MPPGLTLSPTGTIAGTPTTVGRYEFTVRARDAKNCPGNEFYTLDVTCLTITISPLQLLTRTVGELFTQSFTVSGGGPLQLLPRLRHVAAWGDVFIKQHDLGNAGGSGKL